MNYSSKQVSVLVSEIQSKTCRKVSKTIEDNLDFYTVEEIIKQLKNLADELEADSQFIKLSDELKIEVQKEG